MADPQVKVKFTTDTSALKSGMDQATSDAKQKVKELSDDVSKESRDMEDSLDKVADSTKDIGNAADQASQGVKGLEKQVADSSSSMEKNLESVSKKMSAMTAFSMGARGIGIVGGMGAEIAKAYGADDTASLIGTATNVGQSSLQGAAAGFAFAGPVGAAIGGLTGAAQSLLKAGNDLQEAAKAQDKTALSDLETQRQSLLAEERQRKFTAEAQTLVNQGTEDGGTELDRAMAEVQRRIDDLTARRNDVAMNYDPEDPFGAAEKMRGLNDQIQFATEKLQIFAQVAAARDEEIKAAEEAVEARKREAEAVRRVAEEKERREKEAAAREQARQEAVAAREAEKADRQRAREEEAARRTEERSVRDQLKEAQSELTGSQRELEGVGRTTVGVTDDLTRIGGGAGYASYNNSVGDNVKTISNSLKQLIQLQQSNVDRLVNTLEDIKVTGAGTWGD